MGSPPPTGGKPGVRVPKKQLQQWKKQLDAISKKMELYIKSADY